MPRDRIDNKIAIQLNTTHIPWYVRSGECVVTAWRCVETCFESSEIVYVRRPSLPLRDIRNQLAQCLETLRTTCKGFGLIQVVGARKRAFTSL